MVSRREAMGTNQVSVDRKRVCLSTENFHRQPENRSLSVDVSSSRCPLVVWYCAAMHQARFLTYFKQSVSLLYYSLASAILKHPHES
jgi:hypothetical protein